MRSASAADATSAQGKVAIVLHQESSSPGLVGALLQQAGYHLDRRCPAMGQPLPTDLDDYAAVVVFGGPMSANDDTILPFIRTELDWITSVLEAEKPFLGICLGAQLLARVLGGKVRPHPDGLMEIGYSPIHTTASGKMEWGDLNRVFQWHREGFTLPSDSVLLARGDRFPNQAYRYRHNAYGLQFHPEITETLIDTWTTRAADHLKRPEAQPRSAQLQTHASQGKVVEGWLSQFLSRWLEEGATSWEQVESA